MPLADEVIIYPAHGPGSACGKNLGPETFSTIGEEKKFNYALQQKTKEDFVQAVTSGLEEPPEYFPVNAKINKEGYDNIDELVAKGKKTYLLTSSRILLGKMPSLLIPVRPLTLPTASFRARSVLGWKEDLQSGQEACCPLTEQLSWLLKMERKGNQ